MTRRFIKPGLAALALAAGLASPGSTTAQEREVRRLEIFGAPGTHLGVRLADVTSGDLARLKLSEERGAVVTDVEPGTPAERAGLKEGDVILRYQDQDVSSVAQLVRLVRETPAGRRVALEISRDGQPQKLAATLAESNGPRWVDHLLDGSLGDVPLPRVAPLPDGHRGLALRDMLFERGARKLGIEYQEISGQLARYFKLDGPGLLVTQVDPEGPADKAGLKAGDVLLKVDGQPVEDADALRRAVAGLDPGTEATLSVQREGTTRELKLKAGGRRPDAKRSGDET